VITSSIILRVLF